MHNSASSLNTLYIAERAQLYYVFLLLKSSLTWRCFRNRNVSLCRFAKDNIIRKCAVKKKMLIFTVLFSDSAQPCYPLLAKIGNDNNFLNIWATLQKTFDNVG
jgi:hypothetical protein